MYNEVRQGTSVAHSRSAARDRRFERRGPGAWLRKENRDTIYEAVLDNTLECSKQTRTNKHLGI